MRPHFLLTARMSSLVAMSSVVDKGLVDSRLWRTVQSSKETRRALAKGRVPVTWLSLAAEDETLASRLDVIPRREKLSHGDPLFEEYNAVSKQEFLELYDGGKLDPANCELTSRSAAVVVNGLAGADSSSKAFCDLGSASGFVTFAAAFSEKFTKCGGLELSRRNHENALRTKQKLVTEKLLPEDKIHFFQGDLRTFENFKDYDLFFCAVRGAKSRPDILNDFFRHIFKDPKKHFPNNQNKRFVCAGFGIDLHNKFYEPYLTLTRAFCLKRITNDDEGLLLQREKTIHELTFDDAEPLYGDNEGPRVLVEYTISPPATPIDSDNNNKKTKTVSGLLPSSRNNKKARKITPPEP